MTSTVRSATSTDVPADRPAGAGTRLAETRAALSGLAGRARSMDAARVLLRVGAIAVPLGLLAIVLGYWGAAHAPREIEQTPYLISGGLLGLALVVVGGFAYFGYWLSRTVAQQQRIIELLDRQGFDTGASRPAPDGEAARAAPVQQESPGTAPVLLATPAGSIAHLPECPVVADRTDTRVVDAEEGLDGCKICRPPTTST